MVATSSSALPLGTAAPPFALPDSVSGGDVSLDDLAGAPALVVAFISNHCPYVRHIAAGLASAAADLVAKGAAVVAIGSNDTSRYPEDGPVQMASEAARLGYPFPYLHDESQEVAKAYGAACTPDFFVFDATRRLVYRGQFDDSRPGSRTPVTGSDLRGAVEAVIAGRAVSGPQRPSIGCSIKWKTGNEPD